MIFSLNVYAQNQLTLKITQSSNEQTFLELLRSIEEEHSIRIFRLNDWFEAIPLEKSFDGYTIDEFLSEFFNSTDFSFFPLYSHAIVIIKDPSNELERLESIKMAISQDKSIESFQVGIPDNLFDKSKVTLSGLVTDIQTGEGIPNATITINDANGVVTNVRGEYQISLEKGLYLMKVNFVDYDEKVIDLQLFDDGELDIILEKNVTFLNEIVVESENYLDLTSRRAGEIKLSVVDMKRSPTFLGETDLIKQIQSLPGVVSVGEAAMGFNVRGGSVDQNLILYDNLPVFNSSHVFGFITAFNPETIRGVSFYNGGIPARFGGRISSVLDVQSINPDQNEIKGKAGIGLFTNNGMISMPLKKNRSSFFASFRTTYSDWLTRSIKTDYVDLSKSSISFYDGSVKYVNRFKNDSRLSLSTYTSNDEFSLTGDTTYQWSNTVISANFAHQLPRQISSNLTVGTSIYSYGIFNQDQLNASKLSYSIINNVAKADFNKKYNQHDLTAGWELNFNVFNPGTLEPNSSVSTTGNISLDKKHTIENALFITNECNWDSKTKAEAGLRIPVFASFGRDKIFQYEDGVEKSEEAIADTLEFGRMESIKSYLRFEPRISIVRQLNAQSSIKFGYHRIYQFLHLISNSAAVAPTDIWLPSGYHFRPQRSDQFSIGYFNNFRDKEYGFSTEVFYKFLDNVLDFKRGSELILNPNLETELLQGKGNSYGIETSLTKNKGRITGSFNYTYSRSFRRVQGSLPQETINDGDRYPTNFDQPHVLNLNWNYRLSKRHFFTGNFTFHSGRPVTVPLASFSLENSTLTYFSKRNEFRIPDYHRLDLALVIEGNHKLDKWWNGTWIFSVYNVYARRNAYTVFFRKDENLEIPRPFQLAIIGTVFPSLTYKLDF